MTNMNGDSRSTAELFKQWRKLAEVQPNLTKNGLLNANATPSEVIPKLREVVPPEIFQPRSRRRTQTPKRPTSSARGERQEPLDVTGACGRGGIERRGVPVFSVGESTWGGPPAPPFSVCFPTVGYSARRRNWGHP